MDYVLVLVKKNRKLLFIEKNRPDWQVGKINLVGGKVEPGESFKDAAFRELYEESGIIAKKMIEYGSMIGDFGEIKVFLAKHITSPHDFPKTIDGEVVFFDYWEKIKENPKLLPNLKIIVPLICCTIKGWKIYNLENNSFKVDF